MSSRSTTKAATSVVEPNDPQVDECVTTPETDVRAEEGTNCQIEAPETDPQRSAVADVIVELASDAALPETTLFTSSSDEVVEQDAETELRPDDLGRQLEELVRSVGVVEELSRRAREAATGDLARYDALLASKQQYRRAPRRASHSL